MMKKQKVFVMSSAMHDWDDHSIVLGSEVSTTIPKAIDKMLSVLMKDFRDKTESAKDIEFSSDMNELAEFINAYDNCECKIDRETGCAVLDVPGFTFNYVVSMHEIEIE